MKVFLWLSIPIFAASCLIAQSRELSLQERDFFETNIRPQLIKHCYECHSVDSEKIKGGLLLDTKEAALQGGNTGAAIVPGDPDASLLYVAISYRDDSLEMPPRKPLPDSVVADFKKWIAMGAPDPRAKSVTPPRSSFYTNSIDVEAGKKAHWAYQKPARSNNRKQNDWSDKPIDQYIHSKLQESGLGPAQDADALTILRRLTFDLVGLPPTLDQVNSFAEEYREQPDEAISQQVDQLLEMPQFGEKWGRHWLDVARYAESSGKESNATFPDAWRYRDWVIDAYNKDLPFDRMIRAQLAGDLLEAEPGNQTIATGFLALGVKGLNERNRRQFRFDVADEQIDTTTRAFLGTTAACARCHDHKFDPIPMSDYYAMAGIFLSSRTHFGTAPSIQNQHSTDLITLPLSYSDKNQDLGLAELIDREFQLETLKERRDERLAAISEARASGDNDRASQLRLSLLILNTQIGIQTTAQNRYRDDGKLIPTAMGMSDREDPFDSQILIRGEEENATKERVARGFLQVLKTNTERQISSDQSGRLQLADWIASPENPLTARVYANRIWGWLFGDGIVRTVDNFGTTGEQPSHPELLDYLSNRLVELNWSTKDLIREIVNSRTYRMSSDQNKMAFELDPENRLVWRAPKRRLVAEELRDSILLLSGQLDMVRPSGSLVADAGPGFVGRSINEAVLSVPVKYRSVYLPIVRDLVPEGLNLFDFPDPSLITGKREITTVPSQALYLMNSEFATQAGSAMAKRLTGDLNLTGADLVNVSFLMTFTRPPSQEEVDDTISFFEKFTAKAVAEGKSEGEAKFLAVSSFCQALFSSAEFRYIN